jgi:hypothetical protein
LFGPWWSDYAGGKIQQMIGNEYLATTSDGELLGISAAASAAIVLGAYAGFAAAGAGSAFFMVSFSVTETYMIAGGFAGGAGYIGLTGSASVFSGGHSAAPTSSGLFAAWSNGTQIGGMVGSIAEAAGWQCAIATCFVAGTQVLVPAADGELAFASPLASSSGADESPLGEGPPFWAWFALLVGIGGYVATRQDSSRDEQKRRNRALRTLFGDDYDRLEGEDDGVLPVSSQNDDEYQRGIDALCDALFHCDDLLDASTAEAERPTVSASTASARNTLVFPATRPSTRRVRPSRRPAFHCRTKPPKRSRAAGIRSYAGTIWLVTCLLFAGWLGVRSSAPRHGPAVRATGAVAVSAQMQAHASRAIEDIQVGQRVVGENPHLAADDHRTQTVVDPATWRLVKLHSDWRWDDGTLDTVEVESLQPVSWIEQHEARPGHFVPLPLDLTEMGMPEDLRANVVSIEPCPPVTDGLGHVVLTTVNHLNPFICELVVEDRCGRRETIKPTGYHKFYSETRTGWVSASDLQRGERLRGIDGPLSVADVQRAPGVERVYNFTVEDQHVYHVSTLGALVHNTGCNPWFGTPGYGTQIHQNFPDAVTSHTGTSLDDWTFNVSPGQTGIDAAWTGAGGGANPGFNYAELKPATLPGYDTFLEQMQNWQQNGLPTGQTSLWGYDENGNISSDTGTLLIGSWDKAP